MENKFRDFSIVFDKYPTMDNFHKLNIEIRRGTQWDSFNRNYLSLDVALLLTSSLEEKVKQGIDLYEDSVLFWLSRITGQSYK